MEPTDPEGPPHLTAQRKAVNQGETVSQDHVRTKMCAPHLGKTRLGVYFVAPSWMVKGIFSNEEPYPYQKVHITIVGVECLAGS